MNKVKRRAMSALLVAALVFCGIGVYIYRYINHGAEWATFAANSSVYTSGVLNTGTLTDRNGVVLAHAADGAHAYADDSAVRRACYHVVGDYAGNVGTGALGAFSAQLAGYNPITGTYASGGHEVALTIDSALNVVALNALNGRKGAVLVSNYKTGEILCMTSSPTTDPADESAVIADGTYLNRCINSTFTPGSIFKLITAAAAIEQISDLESRTFT
ncbi:MAG: penicillin-binding transpeptidase domain-containing protein, partial [Oscillospiraceae bacterium]